MVGFPLKSAVTIPGNPAPVPISTQASRLLVANRNSWAESTMWRDQIEGRVDAETRFWRNASFSTICANSANNFDA